MREEMNSRFAEIASSFEKMNARFDSVDKRLGKIEYNVSVLADGLISLRRDVQTLTIASAGHGERLAHVESELERIASHYPAPPQ